MGWWEVEGTNDTVGDDPLDILGAAARAVVEAYEEDLGRKPTRAEWEHLLEALLGDEDSDDPFMSEGAAAKVTITLPQRPKA